MLQTAPPEKAKTETDVLAPILAAGSRRWWWPLGIGPGESISGRSPHSELMSYYSGSDSRRLP